MGIFQPAGAGTAIHIYDDNDATGGHVAGSPHTWAEINTAFPVDFPILQTAAGARFSATHPQYCPNVTINIGHPTAGNPNLTSLVDTSGADIYSIGTRLQFPVANAATTTFILGTKIGTGVRMGGKNGGTIHQSGALIFVCTTGLYGCHIETVAGTNSIQFRNATASYMEIAGCSLMAAGSYVLGNSDAIPLRIYNSSFGTITGATVVTSADGIEAGNVTLAATAPDSFFRSGSANRVLSQFVLSGAPATADVRQNAGGQGWEFRDLTFSDTPGVPRLNFATAVALGNGMIDYRTFNTKVVDPNGNALAGIPVYLTSDYFGVLVDDVTEADGDVVFTFAGDKPNLIPVREYYSTVGGDAEVQDTVYTLTVNGYGALNPPVSGYKTKQITFEWVGRDKFGSGYQADGGSFEPATAVIQLEPGTPSHAPLWTECEVVP